MLRATSIVRKAAVKEDRVTDTAWLDHPARRGGPAALKSHSGLEFSLDLDRPAILNDGDAVKLEDGRLIRVKAAPERLLEVRAENPLRLLRFAWQLGGRHAPAELTRDAVYVQADPSLAEMARGQGCIVAEVTRPFQPEHVEEHACDHHDHGHAHDHGGGPGEEHHHGDENGHEHSHAGHEHAPACGCGHKHEP
jgi:urease accessory protein